MKKYVLIMVSLFLAQSSVAEQAAKISLLPHQLAPVQYLKNNPGIRGLLINHYMGTGKT